MTLSPALTFKICQHCLLFHICCQFTLSIRPALSVTLLVHETIDCIRVYCSSKENACSTFSERSTVFVPVPHWDLFGHLVYQAVDFPISILFTVRKPHPALPQLRVSCSYHIDESKIVDGDLMSKKVSQPTYVSVCPGVWSNASRTAVHSVSPVLFLLVFGNADSQDFNFVRQDIQVCYFPHQLPPRLLNNSTSSKACMVCGIKFMHDNSSLKLENYVFGKFSTTSQCESSSKLCLWRPCNNCRCCCDASDPPV